jgi:predicted small lipoprotein YifL
MKKTLLTVIVLLLALSMLTACGSTPNNNTTPPDSDDGSQDNTDSSPDQDDNFVKSSQLIPLEDAKRIVHESLEISIDKKTNQPEIDLPTKSQPGYATTYTGKSFLILVVTVNYNESYIEGIKRDLDTPDFIVHEDVDGVGDWAVFVESLGKSLYVGYKDMFLNITITGMKSVSIPEEDMDGIFIELGKFALERYDSLT